MSKHTPGKCSCNCTKPVVKVEKLANSEIYIVTCWCCGRRTSHHTERDLAIKEWNETIAAPELLEALDNLLSLCRSECDGVWEGDDAWHEAKTAESIIRKARGE